MLETNGTGGQHALQPPPRLYERLAQLSGYTWDQSVEPFHSSYDNWHVFGIRHRSPETSGASSLHEVTKSNTTSSPRNSPRLGPRPFLKHSRTGSVGTNEHSIARSEARSEGENTYVPVVARISTHLLRIEREYHLCKSFIQTSDPHCSHTVRPIDLIRLPSRQGDEQTLIVSIFKAPGRNYLKELVDFGPAWLGPRRLAIDRGVTGSNLPSRQSQVSLPTFLDFAIGACECLELLHHGLRTVHGELRADAFHFNHDSGAVKLINFGSGPRSFENGLTSSGWITLSRELGVKNKLQYIAPEQTGRMPAEPNSRTDIYGLGILFWTMLTGKLPFHGETPIDIIQAVLGRRIPFVSSERIDVPDAISRIIQIMTQKQMDERYHSISGVKHDLVEVQRLLGEGDNESLADFRTGLKDISSFFVLPTMSGKQEDCEKIVEVIEKVAKWQKAKSSELGRLALGSYTSTSTSTMSDHMAFMETGTKSSETSSQPDSGRLAAQRNSYSSADVRSLSNEPPERPVLEVNDSRETVDTVFSINTQGTQKSTHRADYASSSGHNNNNTSGQTPRRRGSHKSLRRRRCELINIVGAAGSGKSSLIQSAQPDIRKIGYFATAKFDPARKAPYEPLLRAMSSLFRQIFSVSEIDSDYHNMIRKHIRGLWPSVCSMLDLPESLIAIDTQYTSKPSPFTSIQGLNASIKADFWDSNSTRSTQSGGLVPSGYLSTDFLRGGANPRSLKFITIFVEVLRIISTNKLICLCLDDLQFADEESIDLISSVMAKKLGIVLLTTCIDTGSLPKTVEHVLKHNSANITTISLSPLSEAKIVQYVATTLYRPEEYVIPLAVICFEKTNGNPFYLRQMLEVCHRKSCIWYSWKESVWEYDIDRIFKEFESDSFDQQLNTNFMTKRLQDLPTAARSILAWASLLGNTFSFALVQRLLSGEFEYAEDNGHPIDVTCTKNVELFTPRPVENVVEGLQATLQAYIVMPGSNEDEFSFSHDRYVQASESLRECHNVEKMHFMIVQTMIKYPDLDTRSSYFRARHVCQAVNVIKRRISNRYLFRALLCEAAEKAVESGARPTALDYYETCLALMQQPDPWKEGARDVFYEETLSLYTKAATLYWHQGQPGNAQNLLDSLFAGARTASDKAPSWILQSKLFAQAGNMAGAFTALKTSLLELGLDIAATPTWERCDKEYRELRNRFQTLSLVDLARKPLNIDPNIIAMGAVLIEATSAAFWTDSLLYYQLVLKMIERHLTCEGTFSQIGLSYSYFAVICIDRGKDLAFGIQMNDMSNDLLKLHGDSYLRGRGLAMSALFISHLSSPLRSAIEISEEAIDHSLVSGDKHVFLLCVAFIALSRLFLGDDMADIESYVGVGAEDFGDWANDMRGGIFLTACRQSARALQGKTWSDIADTTMSDEGHNTANYMDMIASCSSDVERPRDIYDSIQTMPLYLYGHYDKVIELCAEVASSVHQLWSMRITRVPFFYGSLSLLANLRDNPADRDREAILVKVKIYRTFIVQWQAECNINYLMWTLLIDAEMAEVEKRYGDAIQAYEAAIDHTQLHDFLLEQALAFELQGDFFVRRGARRAARATLKDALATYSRMGASGKVSQLTAKHEWVLRASTTVRTRDAMVQTADSIGQIGNTQFRIEENERQETRNLGKETAGDRTQAWVSPENGMKNSGQDISDLGLDVLDLQSILEFNQAISSELQIDKLLAQMTEIILESAGAQADFAGIVIENECGWCIAASGNADGISADPLPVSNIRDETQKQLLLYTMRFKEVVFVHNVAQDDRFLAHGSARSVISLPIFQGKDLLGVLYLEGQPNSFTDRNLGVLQLFCNQVGISIANALLFRRIAKVSAANTSMIESQKRALDQARKAEIKAKKAEAEAMENVRLKEEAAKVKSMFLANVSHELRTPLNGVIGMADLLTGTSLDEEQIGMTNSIHVCASTLLTVINDILDFSKLEAGKMQLFSKPMNLKDNITGVLRALSNMNKEKGLQTRQELKLDPRLLVMGDSVRLHQIFMNLLSNSYKFTSKGGITVRANTDFEDRGSIRVTFSVADTGIGITQDQASRLFQPFSQADSSTQRSYGGSGLGLSICKALVEILDGKISLESQVGVGTTVSFTITFQKSANVAVDGGTPIATKGLDPMAIWSSDADDASPSSAESFFDLSKIPRSQLRVCIAEDNPINQKIAVSFVKKLGFQSQAFGDGLQAVEALRRKSREKDPFHLVLMDVQMPVLDGYDATRLIRQDEDPAVCGVLIIAMTASAIRGDREKCLQAGMNNYLAKPVRAAVLKTMLEDYLREPSKQMPHLQETATDLARNAMDGAKRADDQHANGHRTRPSFEKRMSSRNSLPYHGNDPQHRLSAQEKEDSAETPRPAQPRTDRPPPNSRANSATTISDRIAEDEAVPPLSLGDGAAEQ